MTTLAHTQLSTRLITRRILFLVATVATWIATAVHAQHVGDIVPVRNGAAIETHEYTTTGGTQARRIFLGNFADTGVDHFTSNPGYDSAAGNFATGTRLGINALAGLKQWNGSEFVPATGLRMNIRYLTLQFDIRASAINGFDLQVQSNGGFHKHMNMTVAADTAALPPTGAYLIEMELYSTGSTAARSEPFWIVFNDGLASADFDPAYEWAQANLIPAPCFGDLDGSGEVDSGDVSLCLLDAGTCQGCATDLDGSGEVDSGDVSLVLLSSGPCQ